MSLSTSPPRAVSEADGGEGKVEYAFTAVAPRSVGTSRLAARAIIGTLRLAVATSASIIAAANRFLTAF